MHCPDTQRLWAPQRSACESGVRESGPFTLFCRVLFFFFLILSFPAPFLPFFAVQAINQAMQEASNKQKLNEISAMFVSDPCIKGDGQRKLLKEGILVKQCSNSRGDDLMLVFDVL
jgi:hypothetical protein